MKFLLSHFVFIFLFKISLSQSAFHKQWDYRYGGTGMDGLSAFLSVSDGGFIFGGTCYSPADGDVTEPNWDVTNITSDFWIVKVDSNGIKQWDRRYGGSSWEYMRSIGQTSDGGFIVGGATESGQSGFVSESSRGGSDFWIVRLDSTGDLLWDKRFGGSGYDRLWKVKQTMDGGFLLAGESDSDSSGDKTQNNWGNQDYWVVKTDMYGIKQWDKRFGGGATDILYDFCQTADGGYLLLGMGMVGVGFDFSIPGYGSGDYWVLKIDSLGNKIWDKSYGGNYLDDARFIAPMYDGYILGGVSNSDAWGMKSEPSVGSYDYWVIKIDSLFNKEWDATYGGSTHEYYFGNILQTPDSGLLMSGVSRSNASGKKTENNLGDFQPWLIKTDKFGNMHWDKTILLPGRNDFALGGYVLTAGQNCFVVANHVNGGIGGDKTQPNWDVTDSTYDCWIIKFCGDSLFTDQFEISELELPIKIYPNPGQGIINISILNPSVSLRRIKFYNLLGVLQKEIEIKIDNQEAYILNTENLSSGIYIVEFLTEASGWKMKLVLN